jgi:plastocyanin
MRILDSSLLRRVGQPHSPAYGEELASLMPQAPPVLPQSHVRRQRASNSHEMSQGPTGPLVTQIREKGDAMGSLRGLSVGMSLVLGSLLMVGCGSSNSAPNDSGGLTCPKGGAPVATTSVTVQDFSFNPACIVVQAGATVTWTNTGMPTHTVTSDTGTFDSGALGNGGTFTFTFASPGTVNYHCIPHQGLGMVGTVIVQ